MLQYISVIKISQVRLDSLDLKDNKLFYKIIYLFYNVNMLNFIAKGIKIKLIKNVNNFKL